MFIGFCEFWISEDLEPFGEPILRSSLILRRSELFSLLIGVYLVSRSFAVPTRPGALPKPNIACSRHPSSDCTTSWQAEGLSFEHWNADIFHLSCSRFSKTAVLCFKVFVILTSFCDGAALKNNTPTSTAFSARIKLAFRFWKPINPTMRSCLASQSVAFWDATESFSIDPTNLFDKDVWQLYLKTCHSTVLKGHINACKCCNDGNKDKFKVWLGLSETSARPLLLDLTRHATQIQTKLELSRPICFREISTETYQANSLYSEQYSSLLDPPIMTELVSTCSRKIA